MKGDIILANILRPNSLEQFIGQKHIIGANTPLYKLVLKKDIPHLFFYGKPGTGKTTLAKIIAQSIGFDFYYFNATSIKIEDLRKVFERYENSLLKPLIFIDEVHRLSKNQQEVLLPIMEDYKAIIIGASTENPFYSLTAGIRSRSFVYEFTTHNPTDMQEVLQKAIIYLENVTIDNDTKEYLITSSSGDARAMLNLLDFAYKIDTNITIETLQSLRANALTDGISSSQSHYDITSAMIKSIRGSNIDASIYYMARLIQGGQSADYIARRLVISASEDIGNANPNALGLAVACQNAVSKIGFPEARIILAQCIVYLSSSPKSSSSYKAINQAINEIKDGKILDIPNHIKDSAIAYQNPHNFGGYVSQDYLKEDLRYYTSSNIGFEKTLKEWNDKIKGN
jgi:putative ATPase